MGSQHGGGSRSTRWTRAWDALGHARWQGIGGLVGVISVLIALVGIYLQVHSGPDDSSTAGPSPAVTGSPSEPELTPSPVSSSDGDLPSQSQPGTTTGTNDDGTNDGTKPGSTARSPWPARPGWTSTSPSRRP